MLGLSCDLDGKTKYTHQVIQSWLNHAIVMPSRNLVGILNRTGTLFGRIGGIQGCISRWGLYMVCQGGFTMMWMEPQGFSLLQAPPSGSGRGPGNVVNECYQGREYLRYLAMPWILQLTYKSNFIEVFPNLEATQNIYMTLLIMSYVVGKNFQVISRINLQILINSSRGKIELF